MEIYKTTNKKTGEYYIGLNTTSNPNYLGSGVELKKQIEKYGKKNFIKEILCLVTSNSTDENILRKIEHAYILNHIDNKNCLNKSIGYNKAKKTKFNYHKKIYSTYNFLVKLEPLLNGKYYIKPSDIGLKDKQANPFVWSLIKEYNTKVLGCKTINNYHKKVELATWLNTNTDYWRYKKMHTTHITNKYDFKISKNEPSIKALNRDTKIHKTIIREYLNFKPDADVLSDIKTKVEYYINCSNGFIFEHDVERG